MNYVSKVDLCSRALRLIGYNPISSFSDQSEGSKLANLYYEPTVLSCLSNHDWNFASKQVVLSKNIINPIYGFKYSLELPSDFLSIVHINTPALRYKIQEGKFYADREDVDITYIYRVQEKYFPHKFSDYVLAYLINTFIRAGMPDDRTIINITIPDVQKAFMDAVYQDASNASTVRPSAGFYHSYATRNDW